MSRFIYLSLEFYFLQWKAQSPSDMFFFRSYGELLGQSEYEGTEEIEEENFKAFSFLLCYLEFLKR